MCGATISTGRWTPVTSAYEAAAPEEIATLDDRMLQASGELAAPSRAARLNGHVDCPVERARGFVGGDRLAWRRGPDRPFRRART